MLESIVPRRVSISAQILSGVQSSRICIQLNQEQSQAKRYRRIFFGKNCECFCRGSLRDTCFLSRSKSCYELLELAHINVHGNSTSSPPVFFFFLGSIHGWGSVCGNAHVKLQDTTTKSASSASHARSQRGLRHFNPRTREQGFDLIGLCNSSFEKLS
eukprot:g44171.t1